MNSSPLSIWGTQENWKLPFFGVNESLLICLPWVLVLSRAGLCVYICAVMHKGCEVSTRFQPGYLKLGS